MSKNSRHTLIEKKTWENMPDMLVSQSLRRSYEALLDRRVPVDMEFKLWTEFFSHWMVSKTMSLFGQQDDGLVTRPPDLSVGQWSERHDVQPWDGPALMRIFLAVGFCHYNETPEKVTDSLIEWAQAYLNRICRAYRDLFAEEQWARIIFGGGSVARSPREYHASVWVAVTEYDMISFMLCEYTFVDYGDPQRDEGHFFMTPWAAQESMAPVKTWLHPARDGILLHRVMNQVLSQLRSERSQDIYRFETLSLSRYMDVSICGGS